MLEAFGATLRRGVRASDFAGRWGGEEFVVLLPDTDLDGALQAAETMRASFDGLAIPGVTAHVTASLGVATLPDHAADGAVAHPRGRPRALPRQGGRPQPRHGRRRGGTARRLGSRRCIRDREEAR